MKDEALIAGGIEDHRSAEALAAAFVQHGIRASVSQAGALRVWIDDLLFEFSQRGDEFILADPCANTPDESRESVIALVRALEAIGARSRFEIYEGEHMTSYHHVKWPVAAGGAA